MSDYNLNGLNPRDFQHLVQALARKEIAAGIAAFGDGPDGARDLTYRGKMIYPSAKHSWNGYLVLGCKFKQQPSGDRRKDAAWVLDQLASDIKKYFSRKRRLPKPEYYILVTNVALSGVARRGGRDRVAQALEGYKKKLGLKGHAIWDYSDLRGFLDGDQDVRRAYGHFITAGDVLSEMMRLLNPKGADFAEVMDCFLQKELLEDTAAKLQSSGDDPQQKIPLAQVFLDLPYAIRPEDASLPSQENPANMRMTVEGLLEAGGSVLRKLDENQPEDSREQTSSHSGIARFAIIGGPGQGKSTLGQYLCQLYRAAILSGRPRSRLDDSVPASIKQLYKQRADLGGLPLARRFPVRVELKRFSEALAADEQLTLFEYVRRDIARLGSASIATEDLKKWLSLYPWLLVLDGLDEVPPSSNRALVMKQIEHFRVDAATCNSDLLIVATTRPQSYSKEFSENLFRYLYLIPLPPHCALEYGRRLAHARYATEARKRDDLILALEKACKNPATTPLMQSPLQVTIMATLLEETGEPPQQRYRLFKEYYETIYKRETRRGLLGGILSERRTDIETIHAHAGLVLHVAGERPPEGTPEGGTVIAEAALSDEQFRRLVRARLTQIKVPEPKATALLDRITNSTLQRLVFLVRVREGWVRFDIPSLKEFMAAEALMTGFDDDIRSRLKVIAPAAYWRNVFLFAVGKCFTAREHLLDAVFGFCTALNDERSAQGFFEDTLLAQASHAVLWGSRLALDILQDGTSRSHPEYEAQFAKVSLELMRFADREAAANLASVYHPDLESIYHAAVLDRLGQSHFYCQLGAWYLLSQLANRDVQWAIETIDKHWPAEVEKQALILFPCGAEHLKPWSEQRVFTLLPLQPAEKLVDQEVIYAFEEPQQELRTFPEPWRTVLTLFMARDSGEEDTRIENRSVTKCVFQHFLIDRVQSRGTKLWHITESLPETNTTWASYKAAAQFSMNPCAQVLSEQLKRVADVFDPETSKILWPLPWPLRACLSLAKDKAQLLTIADRAASGDLGDYAAWTKAESRWSINGVTDDDYVAMCDWSVPFDGTIADRGFPFYTFGLGYPSHLDATSLHELITTLPRIKSPEIRSRLGSRILRCVRGLPGRLVREESPGLTVDDLQALYLLESQPKDVGATFPLDLIPDKPGMALTLDWIGLLEWLGAKGVRVFLRTRERWPHLEQVAAAFIAEPEGRPGLLSVLANVVRGGQQCVIPLHVLKKCQGWDSPLNRQASLLMLAQSDLEREDLERVAGDLNPIGGGNEEMWGALAAARVCSLQRATMLAVALRERFCHKVEEHTEATDQVRDILVAHLNNEPSRLQNADVWKQLKLPVGI